MAKENEILINNFQKGIAPSEFTGFGLLQNNDFVAPKREELSIEERLRIKNKIRADIEYYRAREYKQ